MRARTLVLQSHRSPLPATWLGRCLASVRAWAAQRGYDYRFLGDELLAAVPESLRQKTLSQPVIATDLGRLYALRDALAEGYDAAVWCDADLAVFAPMELELPAADFALGREVWVQPDADGRMRAWVKVHNAFLLFRRGNRFLDFYLDSAERLLAASTGPLPPQFLGPKLLTALHNVVQCPVVENAAMFSPAVIADLLAGGGPALGLLGRRSRARPAAANLCASLVARGELAGRDMERVLDLLLGAPPSALAQLFGQ